MLGAGCWVLGAGCLGAGVPVLGTGAGAGCWAPGADQTCESSRSAHASALLAHLPETSRIAPGRPVTIPRCRKGTTDVLIAGTNYLIAKTCASTVRPVLHSARPHRHPHPAPAPGTRAPSTAAPSTQHRSSRRHGVSQSPAAILRADVFPRTDRRQIQDPFDDLAAAASARSTSRKTPGSTRRSRSRFRTSRASTSASCCASRGCSPRLNHPNIVTILTAEKQENVFFIVMEFVPGETLETIIARDGALDVARALDYTCQICERRRSRAPAGRAAPRPAAVERASSPTAAC